MEQKNICDTQSCCRDVESGNKTSLIGKNLVYCKDFYCLNCGFCFTVSKSTTGCTPKIVYTGLYSCFQRIQCHAKLAIGVSKQKNSWTSCKN